uniref:Uncharacterized protein n=1 Tax=Opuntia streptacantha TaxID=393608 RepID=A0A7C9EG62_OPUST
MVLMLILCWAMVLIIILGTDPIPHFMIQLHLMEIYGVLIRPIGICELIITLVRLLRFPLQHKQISALPVVNLLYCLQSKKTLSILLPLELMSCLPVEKLLSYPAEEKVLASVLSQPMLLKMRILIWLIMWNIHLY